MFNIFKSRMSKHSYLKIYRPCDIDYEQVLFKKRISIGEGIYEYPLPSFRFSLNTHTSIAGVQFDSKPK